MGKTLSSKNLNHITKYEITLTKINVNNEKAYAHIYLEIYEKS